MMVLNRLKYVGICICCYLMIAVDAFGYSTSQEKGVRIELHYDIKVDRNEVGAPHVRSIMPYTYFMLTDIFTDEETKVRSESYNDGVTIFEFDLFHPLYDYIKTGGDVKIPFYVEPGDTLIINLTKIGRVKSYTKKNGDAVEYSQLLLHDFSNETLYSEQYFNEDKKDASFPEFVGRVMARMNHSLDSLKSVADTYGFSEKELRIAEDNIKLQYALWIFEYAPYKASQINNYSDKHKGGWQASPDQEKDMSDIVDVKNYSFIKQLPYNDSVCVASRYFPRFMTSYEHTYFLNSDQYLYYGTSLHAQAQMDSAFVAKDMKITGQKAPSFFMQMAMTRKHFEPSTIDDGSVKLNEVKVIGHQNDYYKPVTPEDMIKWREKQGAPVDAFFSPSFWLFERKYIKNKERAKKLIKKIAEVDDANNAEREALLKAYEEETGHKYEEKDK